MPAGYYRDKFACPFGCQCSCEETNGPLIL